MKEESTSLKAAVPSDHLTRIAAPVRMSSESYNFAQKPLGHCGQERRILFDNYEQILNWRHIIYSTYTILESLVVQHCHQADDVHWSLTFAFSVSMHLLPAWTHSISSPLPKSFIPATDPSTRTVNLRSLLFVRDNKFWTIPILERILEAWDWRVLRSI